MHTLKPIHHRWVLSILAVVFAGYTGSAQTLRYFEFTKGCGHGNWQDSSFIAATSNPVVIDSVLANIDKPEEKRAFISGSIAAGSAGYNRNAGHEFKWHFIPGEWRLVEFAVEVCDGCAYSDLDMDTAYWLHTIGYYCPWTGIPVREVQAPVGIDKPRTSGILNLITDRTGSMVVLRTEEPAMGRLNITVYDAAGRVCSTKVVDNEEVNLDITSLQPGVYYVMAEESETGHLMHGKFVR